MSGKQSVIINGMRYDGASVLPTNENAQQKPVGRIMDFTPRKKGLATANRQAGMAHHQVHGKAARSQTLYRSATVRPAPTAIRSPLISRFAPHPQPLTTTEPAQDLAPPAPNPLLKEPAQPVKDSAEQKFTSAKAFKEHLIQQELDKPVQKAKHHKKTGKSAKNWLNQQSRGLQISAACLAIVVLGGYFTYLNMPSLSVSVAGSRAGIAASFPQYQPDGYRFSGPVAYEAGAVSLKFSSNSADKGYNITQRASNWDSLAVLNNYVLPKSERYLTYKEQGLTVYTFKNQAVWVNGGILFTINANAPLSNQQVLRIANSL